MHNVVLQAGSGTFSQLTEWLRSPTSPEGAAIYLLLVVVLGVVGKLLWDRHTADDEPEVDFSDVLDEETLEEGHAEGQLLDDISESHKTVTAPAAIEWETRAAHVGEQWTTTLYIADYADYPNDGYLSDLFELTDVEFDLTAHITPKTSNGRETNCRTSLTTSGSTPIWNRASAVRTSRSERTKPLRRTRPSRVERTSSTRDVRHGSRRR